MARESSLQWCAEAVAGVSTEGVEASIAVVAQGKSSHRQSYGIEEDGKK
jgi:hypothetical protein